MSEPSVDPDQYVLVAMVSCVKVHRKPLWHGTINIALTPEDASADPASRDHIVIKVALGRGGYHYRPSMRSMFDVKYRPVTDKDRADLGEWLDAKLDEDAQESSRSKGKISLTSPPTFFFCQACECMYEDELPEICGECGADPATSTIPDSHRQSCPACGHKQCDACGPRNRKQKYCCICRAAGQEVLLVSAGEFSPSSA